MGITKCEWIRMDNHGDSNCYNKPDYIVKGSGREPNLYLCKDHVRWYKQNGYDVQRIDDALSGNSRPQLADPKDIFFKD